MRQISKKQLSEIIHKHAKWRRDKDGGERADLRGADLSGADLRGADLSGADLDFSCWPLWCGSFGVKLDGEQQKQLLYHILCTDGPLTVELQRLNANLANDASLLNRYDLPKL